ncbi:MAG: VWA domain-containing protein [Firmicutes bacterium]|nr:VWA domain-containing protein [Bacillota bacterium]
MFSDFFFLLREYGIPVSINEWMTLMEALDQGLAGASLTGFYYLCRAVLVKTEAHYDRFDLAFSQYFGDVETAEGLPDRIWKWLDRELPNPQERQQLLPLPKQLDLESLKRELEKRLAEQHEEHHGGSYWIGTGGTSPFGHSGYHPGGMRIGGASRNRSAVKVAGERRFQEFRTDETLSIRQFQLALRKLRQFTTRLDGAKTELDIEETITATCKNAGRLELVWTRPRSNTVKVILLMDSGGSMFPYIRLCNQLFTAVNKSTHFKDLQIYYFHNCVYDWLYLDPSCSRYNSVQTEHVLRTLDSNYRLLVVGDASMAPSELTMVGGIIEWGLHNDQPGIVWLKRLAEHFEHSVWLNPIPADEWTWTAGAYTIKLIKQIFPMYELTVEGLEQAVRRLRGRPQSA